MKNATSFPTTKQAAFGNCNYNISYLPIEILTIILFILHLLFFISFIVYTIKQFKRRRRLNRGEEKYILIFTYLFLAMLFLINFRLFLNLEIVWDGIAYEVIKPIKYAGFGCTLAVIYFILWMRQKIFYDNKYLSSASNKLTKFLTWGSLILLVGAIASNSVLFLVLDELPPSTYSCLYTELYTLAWYKWIVLVSATGFFQLVLLLLFSYPLYQQNKSTNGNNPINKNSRKTLYIKLIKHVALSALGCFISDLISAIIVLTWVDIDHNLADFVYDISMLVNFHLLTIAFGDYKEKMLFYSLKKSVKPAMQAMSATGQSINSSV